MNKSHFSNVFFKFLVIFAWIIAVLFPSLNNIAIVDAAEKPTLLINFPAVGSVLSGPQNRIMWTPQSSTGISKADIFYSTDNNNFTSIIKNYTGSSNTYNWDVTSIPDGNYYLRVDLTNRSSNSEVGSTVSSQFKIQNNSTTSTPVPTVAPTSAPSIVPSLATTIAPTSSGSDNDKPSVTSVLQPPNNDTIFETTPLIKIDYIGGNSPIDTSLVKVKLDNQVVNAQVGSQSLFYAPTDPLSQGTHSVEVYLKNTSGLDKTINWSFSIGTSANPQNTNSPSVKTETVLGLPPIIGIIIILVGVVLIFALIIFLIVRLLAFIKSKQKPDDLTQISNYYAPQPESPQGPTTVPYESVQTNEPYYDPNPPYNNAQPTSYDQSATQQTSAPFESQYTQTEYAQPVQNPNNLNSYYSQQPQEELSNASYFTEPMPSDPLPGQAPVPEDLSTSYTTNGTAGMQDPFQPKSQQVSSQNMQENKPAPKIT